MTVAALLTPNLTVGEGRRLPTGSMLGRNTEAKAVMPNTVAVMVSATQIVITVRQVFPKYDHKSQRGIGVFFVRIHSP